MHFMWFYIKSKAVGSICIKMNGCIVMQTRELNNKLCFKWIGQCDETKKTKTFGCWRPTCSKKNSFPCFTRMEGRRKWTDTGDYMIVLCLVCSSITMHALQSLIASRSFVKCDCSECNVNLKEYDNLFQKMCQCTELTWSHYQEKKWKMLSFKNNRIGGFSSTTKTWSQ